ncbi:MAG: hypothetical protein ACYC8W_10875 [Candidatus Tyrphobacter sp.]
MYSEHEMPFDLLGKRIIANSFGCRLIAADESEAFAIIGAACSVLQAHVRELSTALIATMLRLDEIILPASNEIGLGDIGRNPADGRTSIALSLAYMRAWSTQFVASLFEHEMTHDELRGVYSGADLWLSEKAASAKQLAVMKILGAPQSEIAWITWWGSAVNEVGMQAHMEGAYVGPPIATP